MADLQILAPGVSAAPLEYDLPGSVELLIKELFASFDGTAAVAPWQPAITIIGPGNHEVGTYPLSSSVAAGASADVSFFPRVGGGGSSSGGGGGVRVVRLAVDTPDANGNGFANITIGTGWANLRRVLPAFVNGADGTWEGSLQIPADYSSGGTITLRWAANATVGAIRARVGSSVVANLVSTDTAYTQEAYVNTTVPGTALQRFSVAYVLSTSLVAGSTLFFQVTRNGANAADTLAVPANLIGCDLSYTSSY